MDIYADNIFTGTTSIDFIYIYLYLSKSFLKINLKLM